MMCRDEKKASALFYLLRFNASCPRLIAVSQTLLFFGPVSFQVYPTVYGKTALKERNPASCITDTIRHLVTQGIQNDAKGQNER